MKRSWVCSGYHPYVCLDVCEDNIKMYLRERGWEVSN